MSFTWAITPLNYDLIINRDGKIQTVSGVEEVRQRVVITLNHFFGEYFLATDHGLPWYEVMLGSRNFEMIEMLIRQAVLGVPGVLALVSVAIDKPRWANRRTLSIGLKVEVEGAQAPNMVDIEYSLTTNTQLVTARGNVLVDESGRFILDDSTGTHIYEG